LAVVKTVVMSELRVRVNKLKVEMEMAVAEQDFMKAHEVKQAILKVEEQMQKEEDEEVVDISDARISSTPIKKKQLALSAATSRTVVQPATPESTSPSSGLPAQSNPSRKKEEAAKKRETLAAEKNVKKEAAAKKRLEKEVERKAKETAKKLKKEECDKKKLEKAEKKEQKIQLEAAKKDKLLKMANAFRSYFKKEEEKADIDENTGFFGTFHKGRDTRLAPLVRGDPKKAQSKIDSLESPPGREGLYLHLLQTGQHKPLTQRRTWPNVIKGDCVDDDVIIIHEEDEEDGGDDGGFPIGIEMNKLSVRAKLLQFHENWRPAYWGTWTSKMTKVIGPRKPFAKDENHFDYDYDSDDDWEKGEGEDLDMMDKEGQNEKDKDDYEVDNDDYEVDNDDYEVDNDFFVPHGYLSDSEMEKDEDEVFDPEAGKHKRKLGKQEFEAEQKKKVEELRPRLWGCYWQEPSMDTPDQSIRGLSGFSAITFAGNTNGPIKTSFSKVEDDENSVSLVASSPKKDLLKVNPSPIASKRIATPVFSPIPSKSIYRAIKSETLAQRGCKASPVDFLDKNLNLGKSGIGKPTDGQCITIDDSD